ncbi:hypothetical protein ACRW9N_02410 [Listeria aquatica]|uniref:hypothetical protein n=1 Tax=Listeria aquatica TaxID=1494960 RepID=UPI003EF21921
MKIILNKCFGGFGFSHVAKINVLEAKGLKVYPYKVEEESRNDFDSGVTLTKIDKFYRSERELEMIVYLKKPLETNKVKLKFEEFYGDAFEGNEYTFDNDELRIDKDAIAIVEQLGAAASGRFSQLEVFVIPDGSEFMITEYDGIETALFGKGLGEV